VTQVAVGTLLQGASMIDMPLRVMGLKNLAMHSQGLVVQKKLLTNLALIYLGFISFNNTLT
jgi:hypothetical protein